MLYSSFKCINFTYYETNAQKMSYVLVKNGLLFETFKPMTYLGFF